MDGRIKKICNAASTVLVALVAMLAVALAGVRLVGLTPYTVLSGSMEPTYHVGSLVYVKQVDCKELKVGDPITFRLTGDTVATHRIIEVLADENDPTVLRFRTQGDANAVPDGSPVHCSDVIGSPVFTIPALGYVANFLQTTQGLYLAIAVGALLLALILLPDLLNRDQGKSDR